MARARLWRAPGGDWRSRVQHGNDRLPGDSHRPFLLRPDRHHDLASIVTCKESYIWTDDQASAYGSPRLLHPGVRPDEQAAPELSATAPRFHVVAYDFGLKYNSLRNMAALGCRVTVVPAHTSAEDVMALKPDGIWLSN